MIIIDAIERARDEQEILSLVATYIETARKGDQLNLLPWQVRDLPLAGTDDLKARVSGLQLRSTRADVDRGTRPIVEDTIEVFRVALRRLAFLQVD